MEEPSSSLEELQSPVRCIGPRARSSLIPPDGATIQYICSNGMVTASKSIDPSTRTHRVQMFRLIPRVWRLHSAAYDDCTREPVAVYSAVPTRGSLWIRYVFPDGSVVVNGEGLAQGKLLLWKDGVPVFASLGSQDECANVLDMSKLTKQLFLRSGGVASASIIAVCARGVIATGYNFYEPLPMYMFPWASDGSFSVEPSQKFLVTDGVGWSRNELAPQHLCTDDFFLSFGVRRIQGPRHEVSLPLATVCDFEARKVYAYEITNTTQSACYGKYAECLAWDGKFSVVYETGRDVYFHVNIKTGTLTSLSFPARKTDEPHFLLLSETRVAFLDSAVRKIVVFRLFGPFERICEFPVDVERLSRDESVIFTQSMQVLQTLCFERQCLEPAWFCAVDKATWQRDPPPHVQQFIAFLLWLHKVDSLCWQRASTDVVFLIANMTLRSRYM